MALALELRKVGLRGNARGEGVGGYDPTALMTVDRERSIYRFNGVDYTSEAALLAAAGGSSASGILTFGPYDPELPALYTADFSSGVDNWVDAVNPANGEPAQSGGNLVITTTGAYRASRPIAVTRRIGLKAVGTQVSRSAGSSNLSVGSEAALSANGNNSVAFGAAASTVTVYGASGPSLAQLGVIDSAAMTQVLSSFAVSKVQPYAGHSDLAVGGRFKVVMPASFGALQTIAEWAAHGEQNRIRLELSTTGHVIAVVTAVNFEWARMDLGAVDPSSTHVIEVGGDDSAVFAAMDGLVGSTRVDTDLVQPGLTQFMVGRSPTGETFQGSILKIETYASRLVPSSLFVTAGDSYSNGGYVSLNAALNSAGYGAFSIGLSGASVADLKAQIANNHALTDRAIVVLMDGDTNSGFDPDAYKADYAAAVADVASRKFIVVTPGRRANKTSQDNANTLIIQNWMKATWPDNVVDMQAVLAAHATSPGDDTDIAAGYIPTSLLGADLSHLKDSTAMGYVSAAVVAKAAALAY